MVIGFLELRRGLFSPHPAMIQQLLGLDLGSGSRIEELHFTWLINERGEMTNSKI